MSLDKHEILKKILAEEVETFVEDKEEVKSDLEIECDSLYKKLLLIKDFDIHAGIEAIKTESYKNETTKDLSKLSNKEIQDKILKDVVEEYYAETVLTYVCKIINNTKMDRRHSTLSKRKMDEYDLKRKTRVGRSVLKVVKTKEEIKNSFIKYWDDLLNYIKLEQKIY